MSGNWSQVEKEQHINNLELKAVSLALHQSITHIRGKCVMIQSDSSTTISYIRRQGETHSLSLYVETKELILRGVNHKITLITIHSSG